MGTTSPFAEQERAAGATVAERFGVVLPDRYGDPAAEYRVAREAAGLVDLSFRGLLEVTGGERLRWLNGQVTQDVKALRPGEGRLAAALDAKGHILADLAVYGLEDRVWLNVPRERLDTLRTAFDRHIIADDVQVRDASRDVASLMLLGPRAAAIVAAACGDAAAGLAPWQHTEAELAGVPTRVVATRWLRIPGFDLVVPGAAASAAWGSILDAGRAEGLLPVGMAALEVLRVEAAWPWFGVDFDESHLLMEALTTEHVSFTKGCYIGQEVVTRVEHQGHLNRRLCGLLVAGDRVPPLGAAIQSGDRTVGRVTSAVHSPAIARSIALGHVRRECWAPGTRLTIATGASALDAEIALLPFASP
jgi:folate-binding protein YgfZ